MQAVFEGSDVFAVGSTLTERAQTVDIGPDFTNLSGTGSYELSVAISEAYASQAAKVKVTITPASGSAQDKTFAYSAGTTSNKFSFTGTFKKSNTGKTQVICFQCDSEGNPSGGALMVEV